MVKWDEVTNVEFRKHIMKKLISLLVGGFFCLSCNNRNVNKNADESLLPDTISFVELESSNTSGPNNNECQKAFDALGDTIFGEVLYGMDKEQATKRVREFQNKLDIFKYKRYNQSDGNGFVFAGIKFMDIEIVETEKEVLDVSTTRGRYYTSFTWKGELAQIVWESFYVSKNSKVEVSGHLLDFISFFENKYGKCSSKNISSDNWFYVDYEKRKNYFPGGNIAVWKTDNRLIQISIKGKDCPEFGSESGEYEYTIYVRFFDRSKEKEIDNYIAGKKNAKNNKIEEERQKSINAL